MSKGVKSKEDCEGSGTARSTKRLTARETPTPPGLTGTEKTWTYHLFTLLDVSERPQADEPVLL